MYISGTEMYAGIMSIVSVADARNHLSDVIARSKTEAVFIERRGQRAAVVVGPEQYDRMLEALEDAQDVAAYGDAMAEEGPNIPWLRWKPTWAGRDLPGRAASCGSSHLEANRSPGSRPHPRGNRAPR